MPAWDIPGFQEDTPHWKGWFAHLLLSCSQALHTRQRHAVLCYYRPPTPLKDLHCEPGEHPTLLNHRHGLLPQDNLILQTHLTFL